MRGVSAAVLVAARAVLLVLAVSGTASTDASSSLRVLSFNTFLIANPALRDYSQTPPVDQLPGYQDGLAARYQQRQHALISQLCGPDAHLDYDVVLLQEVFPDKSGLQGAVLFPDVVDTDSGDVVVDMMDVQGRIISACSERYPYSARGPRSDSPLNGWDTTSRISSGLMTLSRLPILEADQLVYQDAATAAQPGCLAMDCFARKGVLYTAVQDAATPGQPIWHVFNTHMQSTDARVPHPVAWILYNCADGDAWTRLGMAPIPGVCLQAPQAIDTSAEPYRQYPGVFPAVAAVQRRQWRTLRSMIAAKDVDSKRVVIGGDLNLDGFRGTPGSAAPHNESDLTLAEAVGVLQDAGVALRSSWSAVHANRAFPGSWEPGANSLSSGTLTRHLDYVFASTDLHVDNATMLRLAEDTGLANASRAASLSDHWAVAAALRSSNEDVSDTDEPAGDGRVIGQLEHLYGLGSVTLAVGCLVLAMLCYTSLPAEHHRAERPKGPVDRAIVSFV